MPKRLAWLFWEADPNRIDSAPDGGVLDVETATALRKKHRSLGLADPLETLITERRWRRGVRYVVTAAEIAGFDAYSARRGDNVEVQQMAVTLVTAGATSATFAMEADVTVALDDGAGVVTSHGEFELELDLTSGNDGAMSGESVMHTSFGTTPVTGTSTSTFESTGTTP